MRKLTIEDIYLKLRFEFKKRFFDLQYNTTENKIFLFGIPEHNNMGDQAILFAEIKFLEKYFQDYEIICISDASSKSGSKKIKNIIKANDLVFFHGGGNMGDVWEGAESRRFQVLDNLKDSNSLKFIFPQSTSYTSEDGYLMDAKKYYNKKNHVFLAARESLSFEFMKANFDTDIYFMPDIVLSLNEQRTKTKRAGIVTMLRADQEMGESKYLASQIVKDLASRYDVKQSDTIAEYKLPIVDKNRNKLLNNKWKEFQTAKLIITDRLHGLIFAAITGTPVIVFDNNNHKVKHTYENWLNDLEYIKYAEDLSTEDINQYIDLIMNESKTYIAFKNEKIYSDYAKKIKEIIKIEK